MIGYSIISMVSLGCYLLIFTTFLAVRKNQKVILSFLYLLMLMIFWAGGSCAMRLQLFPSPYFWHYVSLIGIFLISFGYYGFITNFMGIDRKKMTIFWFLIYSSIWIINYFTGVFVPLPEIVQGDGALRFVYTYSNWVYLVFACCFAEAIELAILISTYSKKHPGVFYQLRPVLIGIGVLLIGNLVSTFPFFVGFPIDIVAGVINALLFLYALYRKKLFKLSMLISKNNCYLIALFLCILVFSSSVGTLYKYMTETMNSGVNETIIVLVLFVLIFNIILYFALKTFLDSFFLDEEEKQSQILAKFSNEITQYLDTNEIFKQLNEVIRDVIKDRELITFILQENDTYPIVYTSNPLSEHGYSLKKSHPIVRYLEAEKKCIYYEDFKRTNYYKAVWESEKKLFASLNLEYIAPFMSENELIGIVFITKPHGNHKTFDINFIQSITSVCSIAVNNARKYEHAYMEARIDELTGLFNRKYFYEALEEYFNLSKGNSISLAIANIDDFRLYNQLYGRIEGDKALQKIATIIKTTVGDLGIACRIEGKEFAIILPGYDVYSAKILLENILYQVRSESRESGVGRNTFSGGVCSAPYLASSARELFSNTEIAVQGVKRNGKNAVQMYSEEISNREKTDTLHSEYQSYAATIYALTAAIDAKDHYTFSHSQHVAYYASELAKAMGLSTELVTIAKEAGLLHDIGKIGIPEEILNKPGRLDANEYDIMKGHVLNGVDIIHHLPSMDYAIPAVISHHERFDGKGYPRGLQGEDIPLLGRVLCVADSFDAMISKRSYKSKMPVEKAISILKQEAGYQFDPEIVAVFVQIVENKTIEIQSDALELQEKYQ